jgi:hypothetical protein
MAAGLELKEVERRTRLSPLVLRWIEDGQFHKLPGGLYARAYLRAYAEAVGLDPRDVIASLEDRLPRAAELAPEEPSRPPLLARPRVARMAAGALDGVLLAALGASVLGLTALVGGTPVGTISGGGVPLAVVLVVMGVLYFGIFAGVEGRTPGARLLGLPAQPASRPVGLTQIARRAWEAFARQASFTMLVLTIDD